MKNQVLKVHPQDNVIVALTDLPQGTVINHDDKTYITTDNVQAKHKFAAQNFNPNDDITMYGVLVGKAQNFIPAGGLLTTKNIHHAANDFFIGERQTEWNKPDVSKFADRTFYGFPRSDGSVGTANYWLVIPMVFCENRNLDVLEEALIKPLGYGRNRVYANQAQELIKMYKSGSDVTQLLNAEMPYVEQVAKQERLFPNVDGIKFLVHNGGCGGTRQDAQALCGLLAGYITHPNVAGATVLSLGCQNAQVSILDEEIKKRSPLFDKPYFVLEQQKVGTEAELLSLAIKQTFAGLVLANKNSRQPSPI
ncbi:MAG: altronate dehydratase, partial [Sphingobacteriaceae bacterium]